MRPKGSKWRQFSRCVNIFFYQIYSGAWTGALLATLSAFKLLLASSGTDSIVISAIAWSFNAGPIDWCASCLLTPYNITFNWRFDMATIIHNAVEYSGIQYNKDRYTLMNSTPINILIEYRLQSHPRNAMAVISTWYSGNVLQAEIITKRFSVYPWMNLRVESNKSARVGE